MPVRSAHYQLTRAAIALGPRNLLVQLLLRSACWRHGACLQFRPDMINVEKDIRAIRISGKHFAYAIDMARCFDLYFAQVVPNHVGGKLVVDYSYPHLQRYATTGLEFELTSFPEEVDVINDYCRWYRANLGDTVFDIGAYCGVSAYYLSKCVGDTGKVYSFEPDAANYSLLIRNIERHHLRNVVPLRVAVAGSSGTAQFCSEGTIGSCLAQHLSRAPMGVVEEVPTISFQDACERFGSPAFAKIDIEGSEIEVLDSARHFLKEHSVQFVVDTNHWLGGVRTAASVEAIFRDAGYEAVSLEKSGVMTTWARKHGQ